MNIFDTCNIFFFLIYFVISPSLQWLLILFNFHDILILQLVELHLLHDLVQWCIHKSSPITPILNRINPIPRIDNYLFKIQVLICLPVTRPWHLVGCCAMELGSFKVGYTPIMKINNLFRPFYESKGFVSVFWNSPE